MDHDDDVNTQDENGFTAVLLSIAITAVHPACVGPEPEVVDLLVR